ncbi:hypothetical protein ACMFMG_011716 [Clarireedia jacksonii]
MVHFYIKSVYKTGLTRRKLEAFQEENQGREVPEDTIVVDTQTKHLEPETSTDTLAVEHRGYITQRSQGQNTDRTFRARKRIKYTFSANTGSRRIPSPNSAIILPQNKAPHTSAIKPVVSRGLRNNGYIEIENTPIDDEGERSGFEQGDYGHMYRLSEKGIMLAFISRVHRDSGEFSLRDISKKLTPSPPQPNPLTIRSLDEQQAAFNLLYLANSTPNIGVTQNLINTLIAEAPEPVIKLIAQGDTSKVGANACVRRLNKSDKSSLLALDQLLRRVIA